MNEVTLCPNCDHDVTRHVALFDNVECVDCNECVDWKFPPTKPLPHVGRDENGNCYYANDHDGPCISRETVKLRRDAEIRRDLEEARRRRVEDDK